MLKKSLILFVLSGLTTVSGGSAQNAFGAESEPSITATLSVEGMCCKKESKPAVAELMTVAGVRSATADIKAKLLIVELEPGRSYSPRALWQAAQRVKKLRVVQLVTPDGTYSRMPRQ